MNTPPNRRAARSAASHTSREANVVPFVHRHVLHNRASKSAKKPLLVMKFGGTSVGDASCIQRVVDIVRSASLRSNLVVVVSAMSGVTNKLIEAATLSQAGDYKSAFTIFKGLRKQHEAAIRSLLDSPAERKRTAKTLRALFEEGERLCENAALQRELTLAARDSISSLGERLSAPLVAAALAQHGVLSEAIDATEVVVTNATHGGADPLMDLTRERCEARLGALLQQGITPTVTGFLGATVAGALTTLGRGGSDYSATILAAALKADEVTIWTDVDGVLTADPRQVPGPGTIPEISYREAADLAYFGAKVLHPKTLRPVMQSEIPVWIRNTFAPERPGTKITAAGAPDCAGVKAVTAISDVALIAIGGPAMVGVQDVLARTFKSIAAVPTDVLLISQTSSQNDLYFVVPSACGQRTVEVLRREFASDLAQEAEDHITLNSEIAVVAAVGQNMRGSLGIVQRVFGALDRDNVRVLAMVQGSSECNVSFLVAKEDAQAAVAVTHQEFQLGAATAEALCLASR
jgi:bifunctional aspartokinase / homoserine dehydrogenase 1